MRIKSDLTAPEADRLRALCNFTDEEREVFDLRIRGKSIVEISMVLNMSERVVYRRLANIKNKISRV